MTDVKRYWVSPQHVQSVRDIGGQARGSVQYVLAIDHEAEVARLEREIEELYEGLDEGWPQ